MQQLCVKACDSGTCRLTTCWMWVQLGKAYPPPGVAAAVIDLDRYDERQLMSQSSGAYPLVVRMETVTEKGLVEGHSLQVFLSLR